jgi:hypothetical protein
MLALAVNPVRVLSFTACGLSVDGTRHFEGAVDAHAGPF